MLCVCGQIDKNNFLYFYLNSILLTFFPLQVIDKVIGKGAFSKVYLGRHKNTSQQMAVKEFKGCSPKELEDVLREQRLLERLCHPNIVRLYETFEEAGTLYFVMEFVDFGTLTTMIEGSESKRLPEALVRYFMRQILDGLQYLHSMNIIHRDIKVRNEKWCGRG